MFQFNRAVDNTIRKFCFCVNICRVHLSLGQIKSFMEISAVQLCARQNGLFERGVFKTCTR